MVHSKFESWTFSVDQLGLSFAVACPFVNDFFSAYQLSAILNG